MGLCLGQELYPQQGAVPRCWRRLAAFRRGFSAGHDKDFGSLSLPVVVPIGRRGENITILITSEHVGKNNGGQGTRFMESLAASLDGAFDFKALQHVLERDSLSPLDVEGAGDLSLADLALRPAGLNLMAAGDESEKIGDRGQRARRIFYWCWLGDDGVSRPFASEFFHAWPTFLDFAVGLAVVFCSGSVLLAVPRWPSATLFLLR